MKRIWVAKGTNTEYGEVFLWDYCGLTDCEVFGKIAHGSKHKGTGVDIAKGLGLEVVQVEYREIGVKQ